MFDDLHCSLVEVIQTVTDESRDPSAMKLKTQHRRIMNELNT